MSFFSFPQIDSNVSVSLSLDGEEYEVSQLKIKFHQPVDPVKNQPEGEVRGGKIMITLTQTVKSHIYGWAMKPWVKKAGSILFKTGTAGIIFDLQFMNAYCINIKRNIDAIGGGITTSIVISPEKIIMNGIEFDNQWVE